MQKRSRGQRLTWRDMARVAAHIISSGGATWNDVEQLLMCTRHRAQVLIRAMHKQRLVHSPEWVIPDGRSAKALTRRYVWGSGPDVAHPSGCARGEPLALTPVSVITFAECVRALSDDEHLGIGLAKAVGIYPRTAREIIRAMRAERLIYRSGWQDRGPAGAGYPYYSWGPGKADVPKPRPMSKAALSRRWSESRSVRDAGTRQLRALVLAKPMDRRTAVAKEAMEAAA